MPAEPTYRWTPPYLDAAEVEAFLEVKEGIPYTARDSITAWMTLHKANIERLSTKELVDFQTASGMDLNIEYQRDAAVFELRSKFKSLDEETFISLVDYMLYRRCASSGGENIHARPLERILESCGAGYMVGDRAGGSKGLIRRIPSGIAESVETVTTLHDRAGQLLTRAWNSAFGSGRASASSAYYDAVKSVEVLACPLISPKDSSATLGKSKKVLRSQEESWHFVLQNNRSTPTIPVIVSMMDMLWHSHSDRHGAEDYEDVTPEQARAAVLLASTLVGWFAQGYLQRDED